MYLCGGTLLRRSEHLHWVGIMCVLVKMDRLPSLIQVETGAVAKGHDPQRYYMNFIRHPNS